MSVYQMSMAWRIKLDITQKVVLLKFCDCANDEGGNAFPSVNRVADESGISESTTHRAIGELVKAGLMEVQRPHDRGRHRPTTYIVHPERGVMLTPHGVSNEAERGVTVTPDPSLEPSDILPPKAKKGAGNGKPSWVGPYIAIWKRCYNGTLHFQKYMKLLSSLQKEHGAELCINAFENYCTHTEIEFASVNRFAETFGRWSKRYEKPNQEEGERYAKPTRQ